MKTKQILFTAAFLILTITSKAQDKYEFMTITYLTVSWNLIISVNGKELLREDPVLDNGGKNHYNVNPLLRKVEEYQNQNWEVMSFNNLLQPGIQGHMAYFAYLRKKKN